jgi:large subunit ribosomal protein L1
MAKHSKRFEFLFKKVENLGAVDVPTAVKTLKGLEPSLPANIKPVKFDQTVQVAMRLGIDPKQADQLVRGSIVFPHGIGKSKRVLVFAQGNNADIAKASGAEHVGGKDLADKIKEGWTDFDVAIATPDMMGIVGPLGKVLGPRGLMPSPRAGTVTQDVDNIEALLKYINQIKPASSKGVYVRNVSLSATMMPGITIAA